VSMLREVFNTGTATRAKPLAQKYPMAGKTGTTNDFTDAWFLGFTPSLTCGVYVGFDDHRTLGDKEEGARVALPIWMQFMSEVLKDRPVEEFPHSPLLTNPDQVKQILASAEPEQLLVGSQPGGRAPGGQASEGPVKRPAIQREPKLAPPPAPSGAGASSPGLAATPVSSPPAASAPAPAQTKRTSGSTPAGTSPSSSPDQAKPEPNPPSSAAPGAKPARP